MKFLFFLVFTTLALSYTAQHQPPGSLDYQLIVKPVPSLVLFVGAPEEKVYREKIANSEFPSWLKRGDYEVIASGSLESDTKLWEYIWLGTIVFVFLSWPYVFVKTGLKITGKAISRIGSACD